MPNSTLTKTIRIGVVGLRGIGMTHVRHSSNLPDVRVTAVADVDQARTAKAAADFSIPRQYADAAQLFGDPEVDAVVLAVPNHLHAPLAIAAMRAGKHVLVEKPIARTTAEAAEMIAERDRAGRVLMVGMNQRFEPLHQAAKAAIAAGRIGEVYYGKTCWSQRRPGKGLYERGGWFLTKEKSGGGPMIDLGIHRLDLALHLMGFPRLRSVHGTVFNRIGAGEMLAHNNRYEVEDGGVGILRFDGDKSLILEASYFLNHPEDQLTTALYGEKGCALLNKASARVCLNNAGKVEELPLEASPAAAQSCVEHFCRVLRGQESLGPTAEQGAEGLRVIEAIYACAASGKTVYFD